MSGMRSRQPVKKSSVITYAGTVVLADARSLEAAATA